MKTSEIEEINGRWTCNKCGYEWSAMLGDCEIPEICNCIKGDWDKEDEDDD